MVYTLILYIYIQTFSKGDYPALVNAGQYATAQECQQAGQQANSNLAGAGIGTLKFTCLASSSAK